MAGFGGLPTFSEVGCQVGKSSARYLLLRSNLANLSNLFRREREATPSPQSTCPAPRKFLGWLGWLIRRASHVRGRAVGEINQHIFDPDVISALKFTVAGFTRACRRRATYLARRST